MATYTSTQAGDWDAVATWGGGGYPNASDDIVNIGHSVRFNLAHDPASIALGNVTINNGGVLYPHIGMDTLLSLGSAILKVNSGGQLAWEDVPADYVAGIVFNPTANDKGMQYLAGAVVSFKGDPLYYGTTPYGFLYAQWAAPGSGDDSIQVIGYNGDGYEAGNLVADLSSKWKVGQILAIHKGGNYGSSGYINDHCTVVIRDTPTYDGTKTTIPVTIVHIPGGAANFLAGGYVMNLSRNVYWGRYGANLNIGQFNTTNLLKTLSNDIAIGNGTFQISDMATIAVGVTTGSGGMTALRCVTRNCFGGYDGYLGRAEKASIFSVNAPYASTQGCVLDAWIAACGSTNALANAYNCVLSGEIYGCNRACIGIGKNQFTGGWFSNSGWQGGTNADRGFDITMRGRIDRRLDGTAALSTYFFAGFSIATGGHVPHIRLIGVSRPDPLLFNASTRNVRGMSWRITMEHDNGVKDAHLIQTCVCDAEKVAADGTGGRPTQRSGGDANLYEVTPLSNLDAYNPESFMFQRIKLPAGSYELRLYVQTNFASLDNSKLRFFCDYLDEASGVHAVTLGSTEAIAKRYQSINNGEAAVDLGGGKVGIPVTGHSIPAGNKVLFANTTNYNDTYTVHADTTENQLVIEETYTAETFGADDVVHDLGKWDQYLSVQVDLLQAQMVNVYFEVSGYDGSNLIWVDPRVERVVL